MAVQTSELVPVLQTAVSPVVLISGVGLLLLTMTNRLGRIVDRTRSLALRCHECEGEEAAQVRSQLLVLQQRAHLVRSAIAFAGLCVLFAALLIITLFLTALGGADIPWLIAAFFILSLLSLIVSLVEFLRDIYRSLDATALEAGQYWQKRARRFRPGA
jgi:Protein of unknown function (DUF2721)